MKERYGLTDMRKQANRMMFNQAEEEIVDGEDVSGAAGAGMLRTIAAALLCSWRAATLHPLRLAGSLQAGCH